MLLYSLILIFRNTTIVFALRIYYQLFLDIRHIISFTFFFIINIMCTSPLPLPVYKLYSILYTVYTTDIDQY